MTSTISLSSNLPSWFQQLKGDDNFDIILSLAYYGTHYSGYQRQCNAKHSTIEQELYQAFTILINQRSKNYYSSLATDNNMDKKINNSLSLTTASRLDAGVHCKDLIIRVSLPVYTVLPSSINQDTNSKNNVDIHNTIINSTNTYISSSSLSSNNLSSLDTPIQMIEVLHTLLPIDIRIQHLRYCRPSQIWLRRLCEGKQYSYYISTGNYLWCKQYQEYLTYIPDELNITKISTALQDIIGNHDFRYFSGLYRNYSDPFFSSNLTNSSNENNNNVNHTDDSEDDDDNNNVPIDESSLIHDTNNNTTNVSTSTVTNNTSKKFYANVKTTVREIQAINVTLLTPDECNFDLLTKDTTQGQVVKPLPSTNTESDTSESSYIILPGRASIQSLSSTANLDTSVSSSVSSSRRCIIRIDITGKGFLKHQIRHIIGTVLEIGKGNLPITFFYDTLQAINNYNQFIVNYPNYQETYTKQDPELLSLLQTYIHAIPLPLKYAAFVAPSKGLWLQKTLLPINNFWDNDLWTNIVYKEFCTEWNIPLEHYHGLGLTRKFSLQDQQLLDKNTENHTKKRKTNENKNK